MGYCSVIRWVYGALAVSASASVAHAAPHIVMEQHTIIRIRTYSEPDVPTKPPIWKQHKGPKCIRLDALGGAAITQPDSVDLVLKGGQHLRANLEKGCPAQEFFYSGFYLTRSNDGQICARRDMFRARMGGDCTIVKFHALVLVK